MKIHGLCVDKNGEAHFEDVEVEVEESTRAGRLSARLPATGIILREVPPGRPELAAPRQSAPIRRPNKGGPDLRPMGGPTPQRVSKGLKAHIRRFINSVDWWVAVKMLLVLLLGVGMLTWAVRWWLRF